MRQALFGLMLVCCSWTATAQELARFTTISVNDDPANARVRYDCRLEIRSLDPNTTYQVRHIVTWTISANTLVAEEFPIGVGARSFSFTANPGDYTATMKGKFSKGTMVITTGGYWYGPVTRESEALCSWLVWVDDENNPVHAGGARAAVGRW